MAQSHSSMAQSHGNRGSSRSIEDNDSRPAAGNGSNSRPMILNPVPGMDFEDLVKAQRRNIDALIEAHMIAAQGVHNIARKQAEIIRETFDRIASLATTMVETGDLRPTQLTDPKAIQAGFERALEHMKELMKAMNETNMAVFQIMTGRIAELFDRTEK